MERSGSLDNRVRRWIQDPIKILSPWVKEGMTVVDLGCGPGYFTLPLPQLVGAAGKVIAVDVLAGMLEQARTKIHGSELEQRIVLHPCEAGRIGPPAGVDFVLAFYMVHEVPSREALFAQLAEALNDGGRVYVEEPPFHVSGDAFAQMLSCAAAAGLFPVERPGRLLGNAVVLGKG